MAMLTKVSEQFSNEEAGQMVGLGRFELPTSPLSGVRSNQLSYRPGKLDSYQTSIGRKTSPTCYLKGRAL